MSNEERFPSGTNISSRKPGTSNLVEFVGGVSLEGGKQVIDDFNIKRVIGDFNGFERMDG